MMRRANASVPATTCSAAAAFARSIASLDVPAHDDAAVRRQGLPRRSGWRHLPFDFGSDAIRQSAVRRDEHRASVGIVFRLRDQIGGDPSRRSGRGDDQDLRRPGIEVDAAVGRDQRLGRRHPAIAGADDLVHARHRPRAVRHRRNGVRAADAEQAIDAGFDRRREDRGVGPGTTHDDFGNAGGPRGNRGHQQRRGQRIAARRARNSQRATAARPAARR